MDLQTSKSTVDDQEDEVEELKRAIKLFMLTHTSISRNSMDISFDYFCPQKFDKL